MKPGIDSSSACPYCGSRVPRGAQACPECGSDEHTGWSDSSYLDGIDLGVDEFDEDDYGDAQNREFGSPKNPRRTKWKAIAAILLFLFIFFIVRGFL